MTTPIIFRGGEIQLGVWKYLVDAGQAPVYACASDQSGIPTLSEPFDAIDGAIAACTVAPTCVPTTFAILATSVDQDTPIVLTYRLNDAALVTITESGDGVDGAYDRLVWLLKNAHTGINLLATGGSGGTTSFIHSTVGEYDAIHGLATADFNGLSGSSLTASDYEFLATDLSGQPDGTVDAITFFADYNAETHPSISMHSCVINHYPGV